MNISQKKKLTDIVNNLQNCHSHLETLKEDHQEILDNLEPGEDDSVAELFTQVAEGAMDDIENAMSQLEDIG